MQRMQKRPNGWTVYEEDTTLITYHFILGRMHETQKKIWNAVMCKGGFVKAI
jgi:hypothetical protein